MGLVVGVDVVGCVGFVFVYCVVCEFECFVIGGLKECVGIGLCCCEFL